MIFQHIGVTNEKAEQLQKNDDLFQRLYLTNYCQVIV